MSVLVSAVRFALVAVVGAGLVWPFATAGVGRLLFPHQAVGGPVVRDGVVVGAAWVGQSFVGDGYLHGRPSAAGYDPRAAAGSNLAASNPALRDRVHADADALAAREGVVVDVIPPDAVAASGSGLDPHITPEHAALQVARVARARSVDVSVVQAIVDRHTDGAGPLDPGHPRVYVLGVNLDLDALPE
jgi:K+-transporting ATPase ATPase C chain